MFETTPLSVETSKIQSESICHYRFRAGEHFISRRAFFARLSDDETLRRQLTEIIASCPYADLRFETPCLSTNSAEKDFEFVLLNSPGLAARNDRMAFASHFGADPISAFANLGGDATLIVPAPVDPAADYRHLAAFCRTARPAQVDSLWQRVASETLAALSDRPLWLSTAGAGVSWLHVRVDR
jgi:hypothetical protein